MIKFVQTTTPMYWVNDLHKKQFDVSGNVFLTLNYFKYHKSNDNEQVQDIKLFLSKVKNKPRYLDSFGYAFTKHDIIMSQAEDFIERYLYLIEELKDDFDYIFSLDISRIISNGEIDFDNVVEANSQVTEGLEYLVEIYPDLRNKLIYSWQTQSLSHYECFSSVYEDTNVSKFIGADAIGGLVGKSAGSKFSIFIGMFFRIVLNRAIIDKQDNVSIHLFGIKNASDRYIATFSKYICEYILLKKLQRNVTINVTYDTISYTKRSENIVRQEHLNNYMVKNRQDIIDTVYGNNGILRDIFEDSILTIGKRKKYQYYLDPLIIYMNIKLDELFGVVVEKSGYRETLDMYIDIENNGVSESKTVTIKYLDLLQEEILKDENIYLRTMIPMKFMQKCTKSLIEMKPFLRFLMHSINSDGTLSMNVFDDEAMIPYLRKVDEIKEHMSTYSENWSDEYQDKIDLDKALDEIIQQL